MNTLKICRRLIGVVVSLLLTSLISFISLAHAQPPGQDTIELKSAPNTMGGSGLPDLPGKGLEERQDMPIGLKAKIARYTALSMSRGEESQASESIIERAESAGFNKTCVQDIGSNVVPSGLSSGRYGPRGQDQVTVLRGDFINVCR